ncbi:MAG: BAB2_0123 family type IV secretion system effector [Alphaproteobacteria bacterium]
MSLPLVNLISLALSALSLIVLFTALRKASKLTAMSRLMANQIAISAGNLQKALAILQAEREICRDESVRLEARLKDSDRVRSEMARAMDLVAQARLGMPAASITQQPAAAAFIPSRQPASAAYAPANSRPLLPPAAEPPRPLPVFVNRIMRTTDVVGTVL